MNKKNKTPEDIVSNNDLLHYLCRMMSIICAIVDEDKATALQATKKLLPEMTEALHLLAQTEGYEKKPKITHK